MSYTLVPLIATTLCEPIDLERTRQRLAATNLGALVSDIPAEIINSRFMLNRNIKQYNWMSIHSSAQSIWLSTFAQAAVWWKGGDTSARSAYLFYCLHFFKYPTRQIWKGELLVSLSFSLGDFSVAVCDSRRGCCRDLFQSFGRGDSHVCHSFDSYFTPFHQANSFEPEKRFTGALPTLWRWKTS